MITFDCQLPRNDFTLDAKFEAKDGITALFGPSGSGKSTVIRTIAGLEPKAFGKIVVGDDCLLDTEAGISVAPYKRRAGLVFQDAQLFPHLDVSRNLSYARRFVSKSDQDLGFDTVTDVLGINHLLERKPHTLSGGERQRVAIGRALPITSFFYFLYALQSLFAMHHWHTCLESITRHKCDNRNTQLCTHSGNG